MAEGSGDDAARAVLFLEYRRSGDREVRNQLIEMNTGLAETVARRYAGRGEAREDLVQVAMLGLLKAVERFEPERGLAFSSFATPTIEGEIKRHFRDQRWAVRMPRQLQERSLEVNRSVGELTQHKGHSPTVQDVAHATGLSAESVLEAMEAGRASTATPLDPARSEDGAAPIERLGVDDVGLEDVERRMVVGRLLNILPAREQTIVRLRFYDGLTQSEIGARLGVSQMQVSRLLARSLARLRAAGGARPE
jgi:RNA polymerase sigma-B factor